MGMSKKDFIDIATDLHIVREEVKRAYPDDMVGLHLQGFDHAVDALRGPFKRANSAFDWGRFETWVHKGKQQG